MAIITPVYADICDVNDYTGYLYPRLDVPRIEKSEYVGGVMKTYYATYRAMSDIYTEALYALVWDEAEQKVKEIFVNACFELDVSGRYAVTDATDYSLNKAHAHWNEINERAALLRHEREERARAEAQRVTALTRIGTKVVINAPKCLAGTVGTVFWTRGDKIGIDVTGKRDEKNLRVDPIFTNINKVTLAS